MASLQFWQLHHSLELSLLCWVSSSRSSCTDMFWKKVVLRNFTKFTGKHLCQSLFFKKVKKEALAQVFYSEFCKISKSTFFTEHLQWLLLWLILVASIIVAWVSWFSWHRFKLEAEDFIFHILQRHFPNFGVEILALCSAKSLQSFYFSLFCSQLVYTCSKFG